MSAFLWGAFGAVAIELVRAWNLRVDKFGRPAVYYILFLGIVIISGIWTVAVAKDLAVAQIATGAAAPAAISILGGENDAERRRGQAQQGLDPHDRPADDDADGVTKTISTDNPPPRPSLRSEVHHYLRALRRWP